MGFVIFLVGCYYAKELLKTPCGKIGEIVSEANYYGDPHTKDGIRRMNVQEYMIENKVSVDNMVIDRVS